MTEQAALNRYNAVMGTTQGARAYNTIATAVAQAAPGDETDIMNAAIDSALALCGSPTHQGATAAFPTTLPDTLTARQCGEILVAWIHWLTLFI